MSNTLQLFAITASVLSVDSAIGDGIDRRAKRNGNGYKGGHPDRLHGSHHVTRKPTSCSSQISEMAQAQDWI